MKNQFPVELITFATERFNITRKSAIRKLSKMTSSQLASFKSQFAPTKAAPVTAPQANPMPVTLATVTPRNAAIALNQEKALKPEVAADYKARAANDDTNKPEAPKAPATPKPVVPQTAAGAARGEGIRLYKLSNVATLAKDEGTTTKALFQHVYGPKGHTMTWEQRAKVVGLATAEEAAKQFMKMRGGKPQEFVKAEPKPEKK